MKSRFIKYIERYLRFYPSATSKLSSSELNMVGRSFSKLPLTFMQQLSLNNAVDSQLIEEWGEQYLRLETYFSRNAQGKVVSSSAESTRTFQEFVHDAMVLGCHELLDDLGKLHSQLVYILDLKKLIEDHGENEVTLRVLWSFCHDVVSGGLLLFFQNA